MLKIVGPINKKDQNAQAGPNQHKEYQVIAEDYNTSLSDTVLCNERGSLQKRADTCSHSILEVGVTTLAPVCEIRSGRGHVHPYSISLRHNNNNESNNNQLPSQDSTTKMSKLANSSFASSNDDKDTANRGLALLGADADLSSPNLQYDEQAWLPPLLEAADSNEKKSECNCSLPSAQYEQLGEACQPLSSSQSSHETPCFSSCPLVSHTLDMNNDPWRILNVHPLAHIDDIKRKYQQLVRRYHPDTSASLCEGDNSSKPQHNAFQIIKEAWERIKTTPRLLTFKNPDTKTPLFTQHFEMKNPQGKNHQERMKQMSSSPKNLNRELIIGVSAPLPVCQMRNGRNPAHDTCLPVSQLHLELQGPQQQIDTLNQTISQVDLKLNDTKNGNQDCNADTTSTNVSKVCNSAEEQPHQQNQKCNDSKEFARTFSSNAPLSSSNFLTGGCFVHPVNIEIKSLLDLYWGYEIQFSIKRYVLCPSCRIPGSDSHVRQFSELQCEELTFPCRPPIPGKCYSIDAHLNSTSNTSNHNGNCTNEDNQSSCEDQNKLLKEEDSGKTCKPLENDCSSVKTSTVPVPFTCPSCFGMQKILRLCNMHLFIYPGAFLNKPIYLANFGAPELRSANGTLEIILHSKTGSHGSEVGHNKSIPIPQQQQPNTIKCSSINPLSRFSIQLFDTYDIKRGKHENSLMKDWQPFLPFSHLPTTSDQSLTSDDSCHGFGVGVTAKGGRDHAHSSYRRLGVARSRPPLVTAPPLVCELKSGRGHVPPYDLSHYQFFQSMKTCDLKLCIFVSTPEAQGKVPINFWHPNGNLYSFVANEDIQWESYVNLFDSQKNPVSKAAYFSVLELGLPQYQFTETGIITCCRDQNPCQFHATPEVDLKGLGLQGQPVKSSVVHPDHYHSISSTPHIPNMDRPGRDFSASQNENSTSPCQLPIVDFRPVFAYRILENDPVSGVDGSTQSYDYQSASIQCDSKRAPTRGGLRDEEWAWSRPPLATTTLHQKEQLIEPTKLEKELTPMFQIKQPVQFGNLHVELVYSEIPVAKDQELSNKENCFQVLGVGMSVPSFHIGTQGIRGDTDQSFFPAPEDQKIFNKTDNQIDAIDMAPPFPQLKMQEKGVSTKPQEKLTIWNGFFDIINLLTS